MDDKQKEEQSSQLKKIQLAMAELDRQFGDGTVMMLGDDNIKEVDHVPTGALTLDMALGIGGLPRGRGVEIYGFEASGKTTLALSVVAEAQAQGLTCLYIDAEHAIDAFYAKKIGVNMDEMILSQPNSGEQAFDVAEKMINTGEIGVVVIDSVAAMTPQVELDKGMDEQQMGLQARMMAKGIRKLSASVHKTNTLLIFINQFRSKIGPVPSKTTPGGIALKYYASVRLELTKDKELKLSDNGDIFGITVKAKVAKNKMAPPLKNAYFDIRFGKGIDSLGCIIDVAVDHEILKKSGNWYKYGDDLLGNGKQKTIERFASDLDLVEEIKQKILAN